MTPAPSLTQEEVNGLTGVGFGLLWSNGVPDNITAVQLAEQLLHRLQTNITTYNGYPILEILRNSTLNSTLDIDGAENILAGFALLPLTVRHGMAWLWSSFIVWSGPMLFLRLFSRWRYSGGWRKDDYLLLIAWILTVWNTIDGIWLWNYQNFGAHIWNLKRSEIVWMFYLFTYDDILIGVFTLFYKAAFLVFFYDIYPSRPFRIVIWINGIFLLLWTTGYQVFNYYRANPFKNWDSPFTAEHIPQELALYRAFTLINCFQDLLIFAMPCWITYKLNMSLREKMQVMALMSLAVLVCIVSLIRYTTLNAWVYSLDVSWGAIDISTWSFLEPYLAIFCACLPAVRKAVLNATPKIKRALFSSHTSKRSPFSSKSSTLSSSLRPVKSEEKNRPPPVGELTAIMNMKTDIESGMGTMISQDPGAADDKADSVKDIIERSGSLQPVTEK